MKAPPNILRLLPIALLLIMAAPPLAFANPIADNPVFKLFVGSWEGSGELINEDGSKTTVKETWTGKFTETGNFVMSGKRTLDQNEHDFAWEYFANGDPIEGQMKMSEPEIDKRFEVEVSESTRAITMKIPMDSDGTLMTIVNTVAEDGKSIKGTIALTRGAEKPQNWGSVTHTRTGD